MADSKPSNVKETDRLFIPIARILSSYVGSTDPHSVPKGYPSHPFISVDLNRDIIIQNAYNRSSYDDEFGTAPDFILDPHLPTSWSIDDIKTFLGDFAAPASTDASLRLAASALGLSQAGSSPAAEAVGRPLDPFRQLLVFMDQEPSASLAHAILNGYMDHLESVFEHTKSQASTPSAEPFAPTELDIVNEDAIYSIPTRRIMPRAHSSEHLPSRCPGEVLSHFQFLLRHAQLEALPLPAFLNLLSQWFPEDMQMETNWSEELRQEALRFFQNRHLQS